MKFIFAIACYFTGTIGGGLVCASLQENFGLVVATAACIVIVAVTASATTRIAIGEWPWEIMA